MKYTIKRNHKSIAVVAPKGEITEKLFGEETLTMDFSLTRFVKFQIGDYVDSHKWNDGGFGLYNFGIFREGKEDEEDCLGVASYGYMKNSRARIFSHPNPLCKKFQFRSPRVPYPPYNKGVYPFEWVRNRKLIKERLIAFINELPD